MKCGAFGLSQEVNEVQPYYCEGLIHLVGLFETNILAWNDNDKKLTISQSKQNISYLKKWYIDTYSKLAKHYLDKKDATIFLNNYAIKQDNYYRSTNKQINCFIKYYFNRYKEIGQELDNYDLKSNYISN